jgi:hypothetical protein
MKFTTTVKLESPIFNHNAARQALSLVPVREAKLFTRATERRMVQGKVSGRIERYKGKKERGVGFTRGFRRSTVGERPAVETGTLINALDDKRTGEMQAISFIKDKVNPKNKANAREYGNKLQFKMGRKIAVEEDVRIAQIHQDFEVEKVVKSLV